MSVGWNQMAMLLAGVLALVSLATGLAQPPSESRPVAERATTRPILLDVGDPAPPLQVSAWLNGAPVQVESPGQAQVIVVTFWASWSDPSRAALDGLAALHEEYKGRGVVFVGVTTESSEDVREVLSAADTPPPIRIALDAEQATTQAYCEAAGVGFVPYSFVIGPDRRIAWHGHPQQAELMLFIEQLLAGKYDRGQARAQVRRARGVAELEGLFREAYAAESWRTALLALDGLLKAGVPRERLVRYKLAILLGELRDVEQARGLADGLTRAHADDVSLLNSVAWDVVSDPRLYQQAPDIGLGLARAAWRASGGQDPAVVDTYARALHVIGRVDLAVAVQERAVKLAAESQRAEYERMLDFYRHCQALQAGATADPE